MDNHYKLFKASQKCVLFLHGAHDKLLSLVAHSAKACLLLKVLGILVNRGDKNIFLPDENVS